jgi:putative transcriptional regulator
MRTKPTFSSTNLTNHFLVAMPGMVDPHFSKTLTFICEHSNKGAIGLVINKPTDVTLERLFGEIKINIADHALARETVYFGGPVLTDRGFVLHQPLGDWGSTLKVSEDIGLTTSKDILEALAKGEGPSRVLVTLGYAGWGPGQLEDEIVRNGWLTVAANASIIFDAPYQERLTAAMSLLGINIGNLSGVVGHA